MKGVVTENVFLGKRGKRKRTWGENQRNELERKRDSLRMETRKNESSRYFFGVRREI